MARFLTLLLSLLLPALLSAVAHGAQAGARVAKQLRAIDADGNGMISRAEAQASPALFAEFEAIDANRDGQITPDELRAWNKGRGVRENSGRRSSDRGLDEAFAKADGNRDGALSREECYKALPRVARRFDAIDANRDGAITLDELRAYTQAKRQARRPLPQGEAQR
jgi:Ca2+-binding EF-hand superfamily protein